MTTQAASHAQADPIAYHKMYTRNARYNAVGIISHSPRLAFSITELVTQRLQNRCGINIQRSYGAGWEKALTAKIEEALETGVEYILFIDGDSVWSPAQLDTLYDQIHNHTLQGRVIDAIVPIQACRRGDVPLAFGQMNQHIGPLDHTQPLTRIYHGHHGLTFVRTSVFRDIPRPWFEPTPGPDGEWAHGRDADTSFWDKMAHAEKVVACSNHVSIGHIEAMVRVQNGPDVECLPMDVVFENTGLLDTYRGPTIEEYDNSSDPRKPLPPAIDACTLEEQHQRVDAERAGLPRPELIEPNAIKIISFCLYGRDPFYVQGMLENIRLAPQIYPGWQVRIYCDADAFQCLTDFEAPVDGYACWGMNNGMEKSSYQSIHAHMVPWTYDWSIDDAQGGRIDVQLVPMEHVGRDWEDAEGMFWRLLAAADPDADAIIFRDADSRLNIREKVAVDAWLATRNVMHVMRDHPHHARWAIMGGMWGVRGGVLSDIMEQIEHWRDAGKGGMKRLYDQRFLASEVWPHLRYFATEHVGPTAGGGGLPWPAHDVWDGRHVGEQVNPSVPAETEPCPAVE